MTVRELAELLQAEMLTEKGADREIGGCLVCDVLSRAISRGRRDMAWITVRGSMNALAAACMAHAACLILPDGVQPDKRVPEQAEAEGVVLLASEKSAFDLAGVLYEAGLRGEEK